MSQFCCTNQNAKAVCGGFTEPTNPDLGRCHTYRVKRDCERPALPTIQCDDTEYTVVFDPDAVPPFSVFTIFARLFDENCLPITDENGDTIITASQ